MLSSAKKRTMVEDSLAYEEAVAALVSDEWHEGEYDQPRKEQILQALVRPSKKDALKAFARSNPLVVNNISLVLEDKSDFGNPLCTSALKILRNLCARDPPLQKQCLDSLAAERVMATLDSLMLEKRELLRFPEGGLQRNRSNRAQLVLTYCRHAVQFVCNLVSANNTTAVVVWQAMFPVLMEKLMQLPDDATFAGTAALLHNCVADDPDRTRTVLNTWQPDNPSAGKGGLDNKGRANDGGEDGFRYVVTLCRLALSAGTFPELFESIIGSGASLEPIVKLLTATNVALAQSVEELSQGDGQKKNPVDLRSLELLVNVANSFMSHLDLLCIVLRCLSQVHKTKVKIVPSPLMSDFSNKTLPALLDLLQATDSGDAVAAILEFFAAYTTDARDRSQRSANVIPSVGVGLFEALLQALVLERVDVQRWAAIVLHNLTIDQPQHQEMLSSLPVPMGASEQVLNDAGLLLSDNGINRRLRF